MNNRLKGAFDEIHAEEKLKNETREFLAAKRKQSQKQSRFSYKEPAAAVCLVLIMLVIGGYRLYFVPVTVIGMEMSPSVNLGINRFDKVVSAESDSDSGRALLDRINVKYRDYTDAVNQILAEQSTADHLAQDEIVEISVTGGSSARNQEILEGVESCAREHGNVHCYSGSEELKEAAQQAGLPMGKYRAYEQLRELDPEITAEEACGMTARELHDRIESLSGIHHEATEENADSSRHISEGKHENSRSGGRESHYGKEMGHGHH